ncbi:hypothetical protein OAA23_00050 [bacterium]|nr:hypothetical protein [bacterium]
MWINADTLGLQYTTQTSLGTVQSPASFMGAFSVGPSLPQCTMNSGRAGTQNDALSFGGQAAYPSGYLNVTQVYDGSSWSSGNNMIQARGGLGSGNGPSDTAVGFGGYNGGTKNCTEEYNGSSWSAGGALITSRRFMGGTGQQNAALAQGGDYAIACGEEYNGSSWASGASTIFGRTTMGLAGSQNAALAAGGYLTSPISSATNKTELYDGTTWSATNCLTFCRLYNNHGLAGTQDYAVVLGGQQAPLLTLPAEEWNGISWAIGCSPNTTRRSVGTTGNANASIMMGGTATPYGANVGSTCVEEYTKNYIPPYTTNVWTRGAAVITARGESAGTGTQNAGLFFGGSVPTEVTCTEEFDGSSWSAGGALITAGRILGGFGTQDASVRAGGYLAPARRSCTEEYNGTSWSSANALPTVLTTDGAGTQNEGIVAGGYINTYTTCTIEYDGTNWSAGGSLGTARGYLNLLGAQNAALAAGGDVNSTAKSCVEEYDGSTWSTGTQLPTATASGFRGGTQNNGILSMGCQPSDAASYDTYLYDGTSWTVGGNALTGKNQVASSGDSSAGLAATGITPTRVADTQLYSSYCSTTLCSSLPVWSGGAAMITARRANGASGTQDASFIAGGQNVSSNSVTCTEEYDGSAWTAGGNLITARYGTAAAGTPSAGVAFSGATGVTVLSCVEEYNGATWSSGTAVSTPAYWIAASGTQNAGLKFGGVTTFPAGSNWTTSTEEYNGSTFTSGGNLNAARAYIGGAGTQNSALAVGGYNGSTRTCVEEYDGSSWSTGGVLITALNTAGAAGENSANVLQFGGNPTTNTTSQYDGATWSISKPMATGRGQFGGSGTATAALAAGGNTPTVVTCTEEFTCAPNTCVYAWSVGPNLNTSRYYSGGSGDSKDDAMSVGGGYPTALCCTEVYNGVEWGVESALSRGVYRGAQTGTTNAALSHHGWQGGARTGTNSTEEYNGSSWSTGGNIISARYRVTSAGLQNSAIVAGGNDGTSPGVQSAHEQYDGSSWSTCTAISVARGQVANIGSQNAAIAAGGSSPLSTCVEEYNGTSWSTQQPLIGDLFNNGWGTTNDSTFAAESSTFTWDGNAWSLKVGNAQNQNALGQAGANSSGGIIYTRNGVGSADNSTILNETPLGAGLQCFIANVVFETE